MKKLILILSCVLALGACKDEKAPKVSAKPVVKIGVIYPMSGDASFLGEAAKNAVNIFFEEFNKKLHKFDYQVIFEDNQNKLAKQATLAQKLINIDKADVLVTAMSNFGAVVSPMAEQNKVMHVAIATDPAVAQGKYNVICSSNPAGEADFLYEQLIKHGAKHIDVVVMNATGSQTMFDFFKKKAEQEKGLKIGQVYHVNPDEKDFRLMLHKIKENQPDYILAFLFAPTIDVFMKQYKDGGLTIPVTGVETFTYLRNKTLSEGMWYVDAAPPTDEYVKKYQIKTGSDTTDYAEYMDFVMQVITFGYEGAKTKDKEKVISFIESQSNQMLTAVGKITTEPDGVLNGQPVLKKIINAEPVVIKE